MILQQMGGIHTGRGQGVAELGAPSPGDSSVEKQLEESGMLGVLLEHGALIQVRSDEGWPKPKCTGPRR